MVHVGDFSEVWWFFPQNGQTNKHPLHNLQLQGGMVAHGADGAHRRASPRRTPRTPSWPTSTVAYQHEVPNAYPLDVPLPWAETFDLNLNSGSKLTTLKQLIPDIDGASTTCSIRSFTETAAASRSSEPDDRHRNAPRPDGAAAGARQRLCRLPRHRRATSGCGSRSARRLAGRACRCYRSASASIWWIRSREGIADGDSGPTPAHRCSRRPDLPELDPETSDVLANYLRTFALWCRHGFADKLSVTTALPGILIQANDAPGGHDAEGVHASGDDRRGRSGDAGGARGGQAMMHPYHRKLARVLDRMGGLYTLQDILTRDRRRPDADIRRGR